MLRYLSDGKHLESNGKPLPPLLAEAARCAGGLSWLEQCPTEELLVWRKKEFIAAFRRLKDAGELQALPSSEDARRMLAQVAASFAEISEGKKLPSANGGK